MSWLHPQCAITPRRGAHKRLPKQHCRNTQCLTNMTSGLKHVSHTQGTEERFQGHSSNVQPGNRGSCCINSCCGLKMPTGQYLTRFFNDNCFPLCLKSRATCVVEGSAPHTAVTCLLTACVVFASCMPARAVSMTTPWCVRAFQLLLQGVDIHPIRARWD